MGPRISPYNLSRRMSDHPILAHMYLHREILQRALESQSQQKAELMMRRLFKCLNVTRHTINQLHGEYMRVKWITPNLCLQNCPN